MPKNAIELIEKASALIEKGEWTKAIELYKEAIGDVDKAVDSKEEKEIFAQALVQMADILTRMGKFEPAMEYFRHARDLYTGTDNKVGIIQALRGMGYIHMQNHEMDKAFDIFRQALSKAKDAKNMELIGTLTVDIGLTHHRQLDYNMAIIEYTKAIIALGSTQNTFQLVRAYNNMGDAHMQLGELEEALERCRQAMDLADTVGDPRMKGVVIGMAECFARMGDTAIARDYLDKSLGTLERIQDRLLLTQAYTAYGLTCSLEDKHNEAKGWFHKAITMSREYALKLQEGRTLLEVANMYKRMDRTEDAKQAIDRAIRILQDCGHTEMVDKARSLKATLE
jgi:tetratricopeptide (TPR) repeat protein